MSCVFVSVCKFLWLDFVCLSVSLSLRVRKSKNLVIINCKCVCKCKYESNFDCGCKIVCLFVFTSIWLILFMSFYITQFPICISLCVSSKPSFTIILYLFARHCVSMNVFVITTKKWAITKSYDEFSLFISLCINIHVFLRLIMYVHVFTDIYIIWCLYICIHLYFWIYVHAYVFMNIYSCIYNQELCINMYK